MKENKQTLYFNMILGTIGSILIALAAVWYSRKVNDPVGNAFILFGFILVMGYISYLENKAGISKKMTWSRITLSIILFICIAFM
ncbi:hypothetical protein M3210_18165 [Oceanobacillus luteolus]|uniref:hypothetical protein n=1 Tax=Oceanobacillus luteolus TaxID=1274358 RepID=UPI0020425B9E|nr:hypothetical protein [Oceanobacillus luteolus]MCM3742162.1 hypothetical protein [Oceanobacillus luteolus]